MTIANWPVSLPGIGIPTITRQGNRQQDDYDSDNPANKAALQFFVHALTLPLKVLFVKRLLDFTGANCLYLRHRYKNKHFKNCTSHNQKKEGNRMKPDTTPVETVPAPAPSNEPGNTPAPVTDNKSADVEQAKREAEQARMRANQLENELAKIKESQAQAERKTLEEKEEFKTLYEQTQARLREIEETQSAATRQQELAAATTQVFQEYPTNVVELAQTAGLKLTDDSDEAKAALKATLDAFKEKVGGSAPTATPNNPRQTAPVVVDRAELTARAHPGAASPMAEASARGDDSVTLSYISQLPAIQRMKDIARNGA